MGYRKLTPAQIVAELEAGTDLWVRAEYGYQTPENSDKITRVEYFGNSLLGVGRNKARVFVRVDPISPESFYTLDIAHRLTVIGKADFESDD
jgi:hypothetical protein